MNSDSFSEIQKTRFLALNFARLQGLRVVPFGLALSLVVLWANSQPTTGRNFIMPGLTVLVCGVFYFFINRYYRRSYGHASAAPEDRKIDWIMGVGGGLVGLAAFLLDNTLKLPASFIGLAFAGAHWVEYIRISKFAHHWFAPFAPIFGLLIGWVSILPILGAGDWWKQINLKNQLFGVCLVAGVIVALNEIVTHIYFTHNLPKTANHG